MFDNDYSAGVTDKPAFPFPTASIGARARSRAGSLSSPTGPPPRLGVSGLYTDHMERRKYSNPPSVSPPVSGHNIGVGDKTRHDLTRLDKKIHESCFC